MGCAPSKRIVTGLDNVHLLSETNSLLSDYSQSFINGERRQEEADNIPVIGSNADKNPIHVESSISYDCMDSEEYEDMVLNDCILPEALENEVLSDGTRYTDTKQVDDKDVEFDGGVQYSDDEQSVLLEKCQRAINDIVDNYNCDTYLKDVKLYKNLMFLTENSCFSAGVSITSYDQYKQSIGEYLVTSGCYKILCDVVTNAIATGWVQNDSDHVDNATLLIWSTSLDILNNFADASTDVAVAVCAMSDFLENLIVKLQTLFDKIRVNQEYVHETEDMFMNSGLNLLYNCSENANNKSSLRSLPLSSLLLSVMLNERQDMENRVMAILCLANIQTEEDSKRMQADTDGLSYLINQLDQALCDPGLRNHGWSTQELARGVGNLARNDVNKTLLVDQGVLPVLTRMSKLETIGEQRAAIRALWALSFDETNKEKIITEDGLVDRLLQLRASRDEEVKREASGILWNLREKLKLSKKYCEFVSSLIRKTEAGTSHVMISYNWENQETLLRVREFLHYHDYCTWMDVDNMEGSTLQAMAEAVEQSAAVIVCMSEKYKDSLFCRLEFEYAFKRKKLLVPLLLQSGYEPDGWLGLVVGSLLYHDFTNHVAFDVRMEGVVRALGDRGKSHSSVTVIAPDTFYGFLKNDFQLDGIASVMGFTEALERLFEKNVT